MILPIALVTLTFLLQHTLGGVMFKTQEKNSVLHSVVVNGETQAYYFVCPVVKNKIPSVFSGNT